MHCVIRNGLLKSNPVLGMGHVGNAVANNLLRKGFVVSAITDIKPELCQGFPDSVRVVESAKEVADLSDVIVTGVHLFSIRHPFLLKQFQLKSTRFAKTSSCEADVRGRQWTAGRHE